MERRAERKERVAVKYARILLFQFVFTKYVFDFRNYDGLTFVVIVVFFKNVIGRNYCGSSMTMGLLVLLGGDVTSLTSASLVIEDSWMGLSITYC